MSHQTPCHARNASPRVHSRPRSRRPSAHSQVRRSAKGGAWSSGGWGCRSCPPWRSRASATARFVLYPDRDQGPPPLGPSMSGASPEGARCLTGLQGDKLAYESYGVVAPAAVDLTPQHQKRRFPRRHHVSIRAPLPCHRLRENAAVCSGCRGSSVAPLWCGRRHIS